MTTATADLSDAHPHLPTAGPGLMDMGGVERFHGLIETVHVDDDNVLVRAAVESPGDGRVLVIDNGGSSRVAVVGDVLAALAIDNGWAGIIVNGCIRDSAEVARMPIGVKARGAAPRRSAKTGDGERGAPVSFVGVTFIPGAWVYADSDGVLVSPDPIHE